MTRKNIKLEDVLEKDPMPTFDEADGEEKSGTAEDVNTDAKTDNEENVKDVDSADKQNAASDDDSDASDTKDDEILDSDDSDAGIVVHDVAYYVSSKTGRSRNRSGFVFVCDEESILLESEITADILNDKCLRVRVVKAKE